MRSERSRRGRQAPALLAVLAACGGDGVTVVTLEARPAVRDVDLVEVTLANANATLTQEFAVDGRAFPLSFSIETGGRGGDLEIEARAKDVTDVAVAQGAATVALDGRTDVTLMLEPNDFSVNTSYVGDQALAFRIDAGGRQIAVGADGTFTIGWSDSCQVVGRCDVFGRRFDVHGAPVATALAAGTAQFNFNRTNGLTGYEPSIATNAAGVTVAAWSDGAVLLAVTVDAAGAATGASETTLADGTTPTTPAVAVLPDGRFIVAWTEDAVTAGTYQVRAVWLDQNGAPVINPVSNSAAAYTVSTTPLPDPAPPALATLGDLNESAVVWRNGSTLRARFYGANGQARGPAEVNVGQFDVDLIGEPQIAPTGADLALLFGRRTVGGDADTGQLILRRITTAGARTGVDAIVARDVDVRPASLTSRDDGALAATWEACASDNDGSGCGVRFQLFRPTLAAVGTAVFANSTTNNNQIETSVAALPDGSFVAAWSDGSQVAPDTDGFGIRARILYPAYDDVSGLGARCPSSAACGEGNICMPGSDGDTRCYRACAEDRSCTFGGSCTTMGDESACLF
jgi:hypothetical protein